MNFFHINAGRWGEAGRLDENVHTNAIKFCPYRLESGIERFEDSSNLPDYGLRGGINLPNINMREKSNSTS